MALIGLYHNTTGQFMTQLRSICPRNWVLNGIGEATFTVPYSSAKYREEYLKPGTIVVIEDPKLPDWCGIIGDDQDWTQSEIKIKCLDGIALLKTRMTLPTDTYNGSAGAIIQKMLVTAGQYRDTHFQIGTIYDDGVTRQMKMGDSVYAQLLTLQKRTRNDWLTSPVVVNGKAYIQFDWLERAGLPAASILTEGANLERNASPLSQRGPIINSIIGFSEASDPTKRLMYLGEDEASIGEYDVRQAKKVYTGVTTMADLIESVSADLSLSAWPLRATQFAALDRGNVFNDLRLGNTAQVNFFKVGFTDGVSGLSAMFRFMGLKTDDKGKCEITGWQVFK